MEKEEALFLLKRLRKEWEENKEHSARLYKQFNNERAKMKEQYATRMLEALDMVMPVLESPKQEEKEDEEELPDRDVSRFFGR